MLYGNLPHDYLEHLARTDRVRRSVILPTGRRVRQAADGKRSA